MEIAIRESKIYYPPISAITEWMLDAVRVVNNLKMAFYPSLSCQGVYLY